MDGFRLSLRLAERVAASTDAMARDYYQATQSSGVYMRQRAAVMGDASTCGSQSMPAVATFRWALGWVLAVIGAVVCLVVVPGCSGGYTCGGQGEANLKELREHLRSVDGISYLTGAPCGSGQGAYLSFFYTTDASSVVKALTADPVCIANTSPPSTGEPITVVNCTYAKYRAEIAIEDKLTLPSSATVMEK